MSSASSRWAGATSVLRRSAARRCAAATASWDLTVNRSACICGQSTGLPGLKSRNLSGDRLRSLPYRRVERGGVRAGAGARRRHVTLHHNAGLEHGSPPRSGRAPRWPERPPGQRADRRRRGRARHATRPRARPPACAASAAAAHRPRLRYPYRALAGGRPQRRDRPGRGAQGAARGDPAADPAGRGCCSSSPTATSCSRTPASRSATRPPVLLVLIGWGLARTVAKGVAPGADEADGPGDGRVGRLPLPAVHDRRRRLRLAGDRRRQAGDARGRWRLHRGRSSASPPSRPSAT